MTPDLLIGMLIMLGISGLLGAAGVKLATRSKKAESRVVDPVPSSTPTITVKEAERLEHDVKPTPINADSEALEALDRLRRRANRFDSES